MVLFDIVFIVAYFDFCIYSSVTTEVCYGNEKSGETRGFATFLGRLGYYPDEAFGFYTTVCAEVLIYSN